MNKKVLKCFIASPGDTKKERRKIEDIISELNRNVGEIHNIILETKKWETDTRPSFQENYSQANINKQIGDYDLFIGLMFNRFGTPTKVAGSGTEEEFDQAYQKILYKENVDIMFYFNKEMFSIDDVDIDQLQKVKKFKEKLQNLNGYYWQYNGILEFEKFIREHLTKFIFENSQAADKSFPDQKKKENRIILLDKLTERFNKAICTFKDQPKIWVDPIISQYNENRIIPDDTENENIKIEEIIDSNVSYIIKAPHQFGLTSLSHFLILEAFKKDKIWIYINSKNVKGHNIHKTIENELKGFYKEYDKIECIVIDSWVSYEIESFKKLRNLVQNFPDIKIVVMYTIDDSKFLDEENTIKIDREFVHLNLLALPRKQVRNVVSQYNRQVAIGSEDNVLNKIILDLETLNVHRTPLNCITLLKVNEKYFDESPVNRTNLLEMVLFALFNLNEVPNYKSKPDLKDCEYILGRFCEILIRNDDYSFSRKLFIEKLSTFCKENLIDIDVDLVFDILYNNNIICNLSVNDYHFKASYWIFYFGAKRMHNSPDFKNYIFDTKKYNSFPEIIEFYTGIDRNRDDALDILSKDIFEMRSLVNSKLNLPIDMNPFNFIEWHPNEEDIINAQEEIKDDILKSSLPDEIKDKYADKNYNQLKPYNQSIQKFFEEYSVHNLMQNIKATSRALRNSDYVNPEIKKKALDQIFLSWEEICRVLIALSPILAEKGQAEFDGAAFKLSDGFGDTFEARLHQIMLVIMMNVVSIFKDDISSSKMAPLIYEKFEKEENNITKHHIAIFLIITRPKEWRRYLEKYITSIKKNSFYLFDIVNILRAKYKYDFADENELKDLAYLIKMCYAKHEIGVKKPTMLEISKISNKAIPVRSEEID